MTKLQETCPGVLASDDQAGSGPYGNAIHRFSYICENPTPTNPPDNGQPCVMIYCSPGYALVGASADGCGGTCEQQANTNNQGLKNRVSHISRYNQHVNGGGDTGNTGTGNGEYWWNWGRRHYWNWHWNWRNHRRKR
eukprot:UN01789